MKKIKIIALFLTLLILSGGMYYFFFLNKEENNTATSKTIVEKAEQKPDILDEINSYQEKYFNIVKRNDALLTLENNEEAIKDLRELKQLFDEIKKRADKNDKFLKKYENIVEKYKENKGQNTYEINEFASKKYNEADKLLNEVYKAIKLQTPSEQFEKLKISQRNWLKEVEDYNKIYEAKGFGTIGTLVKLDYETNMRCFRTLLLILYFNNVNQIKEGDFIGGWSEIIAGRIYLDIKKEKGKITAAYGGANSAYSHSESIYDCKYNNKDKKLECNNIKHTDQFMSCNGISTDDDMEKYLECADKYPDKVKDDYKTYKEKDRKNLIIEKGVFYNGTLDEDEYLTEEKKQEIKQHYENMNIHFEGDEDIVFYKYKG